jgi:hypothetical protein
LFKTNKADIHLVPISFGEKSTPTPKTALIQNDSCGRSCPYFFYRANLTAANKEEKNVSEWLNRR